MSLHSPCDNKVLNIQTQMFVLTHTKLVSLIIRKKKALTAFRLSFEAVSHFFFHTVDEKKKQKKTSHLNPPTVVVREQQVHN